MFKVRKFPKVYKNHRKGGELVLKGVSNSLIIVYLF